LAREFAVRFAHDQETQPSPPSPPRFAELSEPSAFPNAPEAEQPDLDVPAFLRRGQF
jgi:hypothetical protein